jgi:hypothetical protein
MIFGRLWEQTGCAAVIEQFAAGRGFGFSLERAVFASVLHRLVVSGSDRACDAGLDAYQVPGAEALALHQLSRAMAWLGEPLAEQSDATRAPRRSKDLIEEALFERRQPVFRPLRRAVRHHLVDVHRHGRRKPWSAWHIERLSA